MKTLVELMKDVENSMSEMNEQLKDLSALELKFQREIDKVREERTCVQQNLDLYKGVLDDLTKRRDNEINQIEGNKPEVKVEETKAASAWQVYMESKRKKVIAYDEDGNAIAEYGSVSEAAHDNKIPMGSIAGIMKMDASKQIAKRGFALKYA